MHHQVSTWHNLRTVHDLVDYGFTVSDNIVSPVITDNAPPQMNCYVKSAARLRAALHYANLVLAASTTSLAAYIVIAADSVKMLRNRHNLN